jgi:hypothetical protein
MHLSRFGPVSEVPQAPEGDRTEHHDLRNVLEDIRKDAWYTLYIYTTYIYTYIYVYHRGFPKSSWLF